MTNVPITYGTGQASIAGDTTGGATYQQIKVVDGTVGGSTGLIVNADGTANVRISGSVATVGTTPNQSVSGTVSANITSPLTSDNEGNSQVRVTGTSRDQSNFNNANQTVNLSAGLYNDALVPIPANNSIVGILRMSRSRGLHVLNVDINGSVQGTTAFPVAVSVMGTVPVVQSGTVISSISGTISASLVGGSATVIQGANAGIGSSWPIKITDGVQTAAVTSSSMLQVSASIIGTVPVNIVAGGSTGSVATNIQGSVAVVIIGGSIAASFTPPANQSVSGAVTAPAGSILQISTGSNVGGSDNNSTNQTMGLSAGGAAGGLLVYPAVYNGTGWDRLRGNSSVGSFVHVGAGSVITVSQSSVAVAIVSGSISATFTPPANQSVSGTVQTDVRGSIAAVIIGGSIAASFIPPANQSVSGTVNVQNVGSILTAGNQKTMVTDSAGSIISSLGDGSSLVGFGVSGIATNFVLSSGNSTTAQLANNATFTGTIETIYNQQAISILLTSDQAGTLTLKQYIDLAGTRLISSWAFPIVAGTPFSRAFTGNGNYFNLTFQNTGGSTTTTLNINTAYGTLPAVTNLGYAPVSINEINGTTLSIGQQTMANSIPVTFASNQASISAALSGGVVSVVAGSPLPIAGSVVAFQGGTQITSVSGQVTVVSSIAGGIFPISGSVAATITNTNVNVGGSVVAFQGTSPFVVNFQNSSIIALQAGSVVSLSVGSVITVLQSPSIVGTYAEDAAHTTADKGVFSLSVRNDTLASVTSNDGDYGAITLGPAGEVVTANSPLTKWVQGTADFRSNAGASILVIANGTSSIFQYITGVQIANMGSASVLVTLAAGGSTLGYSIAPAGGGSNIYYPNGLKTPGSFGLAASISGVASVLVSAQGFVSKT